jgi:hypothetical protein
MTITITPSVAACQEISTLIQGSVKFQTGHINRLSDLKQLFEIDADAYADCSLDFRTFQNWWQRYPRGNRIVSLGDRLVASIGIWALAEAQFARFTSGEICESDLRPVPLSECESCPQSFWYISGCILRPEYRGTIRKNPLLSLLRFGVGDWIESTHASYPLKIVSLAEFVEGENLLKGFGFEPVKDAEEMPDGCTLYFLKIETEEEAEEMLSARNIW